MLLEIMDFGRRSGITTVDFQLKGNRPIKSTIEFLLKLHTVVEYYMVSEKMK